MFHNFIMIYLVCLCFFISILICLQVLLLVSEFIRSLICPIWTGSNALYQIEYFWHPSVPKIIDISCCTKRVWDPPWVFVPTFALFQFTSDHGLVPSWSFNKPVPGTCHTAYKHHPNQFSETPCPGPSIRDRFRATFPSWPGTAPTHASTPSYAPIT